MIKNLYFPKNIKETINLLKKKNSFFMSSGTTAFKSMPENIEEVILDKNLPLNYIKKDSKYLKLGAKTTFDDIEKNKFCQTLFNGILSISASNCSSQLIRNIATIGGNIAKPNAFNIWPTVFFALNAKVKIQTFKGIKIIDIKKIYTEKLDYGKNAILIEILIPLSISKNIFYFKKISKIKSSWDSYITLCFNSSLKNKKLKEVNFVFGGIRANPFYKEEFEKEILNKELNKELIENISLKYKNEILTFNNSQINQYRAELVKNLISYYLENILKI